MVVGGFRSFHVLVTTRDGRTWRSIHCSLSPVLLQNEPPYTDVPA